MPAFVIKLIMETLVLVPTYQFDLIKAVSRKIKSRCRSKFPNLFSHFVIIKEFQCAFQPG